MKNRIERIRCTACWKLFVLSPNHKSYENFQNAVIKHMEKEHGYKFEERKHGTNRDF